MSEKVNQDIAARNFTENWGNRGDEKSETQQFWISLLSSVFGIPEPQNFIQFEKRVQLSHVSFIDAYIESTKVLIEQKSADVDLHKGYKQSDGSMLTPFQQAKRYANEMPYSLRPRWVVVCNFRSFLVYDMENPNGEPFEILLENFEKEYYRLSFLVDEKSIHLKKEMEVSLKAGELIGEIYDELLKQYIEPNEESLRSLNVLCVRIVFCLYAEDAGIFGSHSMFHDYLMKFKPGEGDMRDALIKLFEVLDTPMEKRDKYLRSDLKQFPYCNGGLFSDKDVEIPFFNDKIAHLLLKNASADFDWSEISPTIFGGVFESTLNPETRRKGGMHYTSIENIHKVIDPLFLNALKTELDGIKAVKLEKNRIDKAKKFQEKLTSLTFLDPACGSGNFLTESYLSLRRLENEAILLYTKGQVQMNLQETNPVKVSIHQFYGIEINDFAVDVATTALWIAESQMLKETEKIIDSQLDMLPLKAYHNIKKGNALHMDWNVWKEPEDIPTIIANEAFVYPNVESPALEAHENEMRYNAVNIYSSNVHIKTKKPEPESNTIKFDYVMGNPPFIGARMKSAEQADDLLGLFGKKWKNIGNLDYVGGWYLKAAQLMDENPELKAALVSTNSITQGEQVPILWKPLFEQYGVHIDFAYNTFRWDSESSMKAHVHCVVVGFSKDVTHELPRLYASDGSCKECSNVNGYLMDGPDVFIESRQTPLCDVPQIGIGNKPIDGGFYLFSEEEKRDFILKEPGSVQYFRRWYGADEFINNKIRYCLWLGDCTPSQIKSMPHCYDRAAKVRQFRLNSKSPGTRLIANKPTRFHVENMPVSNYIVIPETSSERRRYVPMGFLTPDVLCSNAIRIMPDATLYHFGVLTSNVHNAWMRAVGGRLKSDYRYSKDIVYNNFPWPEVAEQQIEKITQTAQAILDVRAKYPECSLADLYDEVTMPAELRKAHQNNDRAVMEAYGFNIKMTESECVTELMKMYQKSAVNK